MVTSAPTAQPEEDIPLGVSVQLQCPLAYALSEAALHASDREGFLGLANMQTSANWHTRQIVRTLRGPGKHSQRRK
jgi:hypothetical protein